MENRIKFRAWNKDLKKMFQVKKLEFMGKTIIVDSEVKEKSTGKNDIESQNDIEEVELMQFTGLKDKKHKKEIYEGDIVRHQNGFLYVVEWDDINACWYLRQPRREDGNVLEGVYTGGIAGQNIWRCEVIGNIFENPELIKSARHSEHPRF